MKSAALLCWVSLVPAIGWGQVESPTAELPEGPKLSQADEVFAERFAPPTDSGKVADAGAEAGRILADPRYRDPGAAKERTWATGAFERIARWVADLLSRLLPRNPRLPSLGAPGLTRLDVVVWVAVGVALAVFLVYAFARFRWAPARRRRAGGLLDGDEPELTADEWLERAAALEAEGRYREAVRCLYIACLVRFDEAGVARFVRTETNWEHLRRIQASPKRPESLDFTGPTRVFDDVWYGHHVAGSETVETFRVAYRSALEALGRRSAA